ncbi:MAG: hypothetical protein OEX22_13115 [Cyclobacteriaceae bacterium]|nr:hypothetical protein [Cyclobacteriaceae bacterium]
MSNENNEKLYSIKSFFDKINLFFHGILAVPLTVFGWLFLEAKDGRYSTVEVDNMDVFNFLGPIVIFGIVGISFSLFKKKLRKIDNHLPLQEKLENYLKCSWIKFIGLELALILSVLGYYLTFTNTFVAMFMIVLVFFSLSKPTPYRVVESLQLKDDEKDSVVNKVKKDERLIN